jgi:hypothetical protein
MLLLAIKIDKIDSNMSNFSILRKMLHQMQAKKWLGSEQNDMAHLELDIYFTKSVVCQLCPCRLKEKVEADTIGFPDQHRCQPIQKLG